MSQSHYQFSCLLLLQSTTYIVLSYVCYDRTTSHYNLLQIQNISDKGMRLIANSYPGLKKLNITRYGQIPGVNPAQKE